MLVPLFNKVDKHRYFSQENMCWCLFLIKLINTYIFWKYCKVFNNIYFEEYPRTAASIVSFYLNGPLVLNGLYKVYI